MKLHICAVGRMRAIDAERPLFDDYATRFNRTARPLGMGPLTEHEVEDRKGGGIATEADLLMRAVPAGATLIAMDERGTLMSSPDLAAQIARFRGDGCQNLAFVIGGADGLAPALRDRADLALSFGRMVWPHMLVRVMLAEQLYRAATILSGGPYHRV